MNLAVRVRLVPGAVEAVKDAVSRRPECLAPAPSFLPLGGKKTFSSCRSDAKGGPYGTFGRQSA